MALNKKKLRSDFDSYLRGEEPPGVEFATARRQDEWEIAISKSPGDGSYPMTLTGVVIGRPKIPNGRGIRSTSPVVWLDRGHRWARTVSRLYGLERQQIPHEGLSL